MKPTTGRIVHYKHNGVACPAIVQEVNDISGVLRLWVFGPASMFVIMSSAQGEGEGEWNWPVTVLAPATTSGGKK